MSVNYAKVLLLLLRVTGSFGGGCAYLEQA